jgi:hypothetical protein
MAETSVIRVAHAGYQVVVNPTSQRTIVSIGGQHARAISILYVSRITHLSQCSRAVGLHEQRWLRSQSMLERLPLDIDFGRHNVHHLPYSHPSCLTKRDGVHDHAWQKLE